MDLLTAPEHRPLIEVASASVSFKGRRALDAVSLTVFSNEHIALRGGNGAGKSTLLRLLRGEQWPDQDATSSIIWRPVGNAETSPLAGRSMVALVGAAQQERILSQGWDITGEDLIFGGLTDAVYVLRHAEGEDQRRIAQLAAWLGAEDLLACRVPELSQGQLRIMLVARGLIRNPSILLLDEVTDGLDTAARHKLVEVLEKAAKVTTLVVSTHRPETLPTWIRREIRMVGGRVAADGPFGRLDAQTDAALSSPAGCVPELPASPCTNAAPPAIAPTMPGARIDIFNADVYINSRLILHRINWAIRPGEHWAVCGDNGAGKSTLLRLIAGDETPAYGGGIRRVLPRQGGEVGTLACIRRGVRLVSDLQQATYGYALSGEELVLSGLDNSVGLYRAVTPEERHAAQRSLTMLGVSHLAERSIRACSTGEMRRLLLARAFVGEPDLLLLDEPCSGLDPAARAHVLHLLHDLACNGAQLVYVSHHENDIPPLVTHLLRLERGRIVYAGPRAQAPQKQ